MENVILIVHLILALCLIGIVLLQRSEGGGLGMGGGGGGDVMSGRAAASALGKLTWIFAIGFICTSLTLTVLARRDAANSSVVDGITLEDATPVTPSLPDASSLLPPSAADAPLAPPRAE
ncbi:MULTISPECIES: preprotein translocase subunit SecG [Pacificibacter]|uniref:preprotein translocase subunit SecG n=1 Tax=Pacificibacter TaxID=1042323 RepID=UPI001C06CF41|nr:MULTISPECIES: preprotein translocase subunit SecG [Pacificibacter]MBU2868526.1 preprotein translocase subunit SecG [Pacificibacter marinus]MBU2935823.1 preprotein translocase subunit SecG [Pacificibacter marinus]MDO6614318.1 preprotein translocase subunit SecG [Pacificibacter sp. 1_MG-2023]